MINFKIDLKQERIFRLDFLRFVAIGFVLLSHGRHILEPLTTNTDFMSIGGFWGVELFFVLSGFLIGGILIKIFDKNTTFNTKLILDFWKRRWFRTLPNYYLILILNFCVALVFKKIDLWDWKVLPYFFFLQNFFTEHPHFFEEAWSLAVEEWFYLSFPLILFGVTLLVSKKSQKKYKFLTAIIVLFLVCFVLKLMVVINLQPHWDYGVRKIVPLRLDSILTGVFFAWYKFNYSNHFVKNRKISLVLSLILIIISGYVYYNDILANSIVNASFFSKTLYFTLTSIAFGLLLPFASSKEKITPVKTWKKVVTVISLISYSMYLLHFSFILKGFSLVSFLNTSIFTSIVFFLLYLLLTTMLSILLFKYYEKPMTNLRDYSSESSTFLGFKDYTKIAIKELKKSVQSK